MTKTYAECTRLTLLTEYRTNEVSTTLRSRIILRNPEKQVSHCFWVAPLSLARSYRWSCLKLGFPCEIRLDLEVPDREDYEGIRMVMGVMDFTAVVSDGPMPKA